MRTSRSGTAAAVRSILRFLAVTFVAVLLVAEVLPAGRAGYTLLASEVVDSTSPTSALLT